MTRRLGALLVVVAAVAALAGCGGEPDHDMGAMSTPTSTAAPAYPSASPARGPHNDADVRFAEQMVPHHLQAVDMSEMLLAKQGISPQATALALRIRTAQAREIGQMTGWLNGWNQDPAATATSAMGHGMGDGMMSQTEMDALQRATGDQATELFLRGMVRHHQGALAMAATELKDGQNADAKALAQQVSTSQQAEITEMNRLLEG